MPRTLKYRYACDFFSIQHKPTPTESLTLLVSQSNCLLWWYFSWCIVFYSEQMRSGFSELEKGGINTLLCQFSFKLLISHLLFLTTFLSCFQLINLLKCMWSDKADLFLKLMFFCFFIHWSTLLQYYSNARLSMVKYFTGSTSGPQPSNWCYLP